MADKKGKALALELIDDLLNEKSELINPKETESENSSGASNANGGGELHDKTVDLSGHSENKELVLDLDSDKDGEDKTVRLPDESTKALAVVAPQASHNPSQRESKVRATVGRHGAFRAANVPSATEAALAQSESLRIAQSRILELEQEIERLRLQNEELGAAGETIRRRADELLAQNQKREADYQHAVSTFEQEKIILTSSKEALQRDIESQKRKNDELELRISTNIQKIRVRERELENRLELVKMESAALIRSKDEIILDLKRQMDQLNIELSNYRTKNQELNRQSSDKHEILRRTVKALRLALSMLEGEEESPKPQRKVK